RSSDLTVQIGLARRGGANMHGPVGQAHVPGAGVGVGVDGHGFHAKPTAGGDDAAGNLASIGNQDSFEHRCSRLVRDNTKYTKNGTKGTKSIHLSISFFVRFVPSSVTFVSFIF